MSERASSDAADTGETPKFQRYFVEHGRYTAGMSVAYKQSVLTGEATWQSLALGFPIGERLHSAPVIRLADAKPMELGETILADARWRLFAFAPAADPAAEGSAIRSLCDFLASDPSSPVLRHTAPGSDIDATIDVRVVFPQAAKDLALETLPQILLPKKGRLGLVDYEKTFRRDDAPGRDIYELMGIAGQAGCSVIARPDRYVPHVLPLTAYGELARFFAGVLSPANAARTPDSETAAA